MVKRYVAEPGSELIRAQMREADGWVMCRLGFVETVRAVGLAAGEDAARTVRSEWPSFSVVEVDQALVEQAAALTLARGLRSLDALHLASALLLPPELTTVATWDRRLHAAAAQEGLRVLPEALDN